MNKKDYRNYIKKLYKKEFVKDKNGRSLIEVNIKDKENMLSSFSGNDPLISDELASFFEHKLSLKQIKNGLHINISCDDLNDNDKEIYKRAITNYYEQQLLSYETESKRNTFISILLLIFGVLVLSLIVLFELKNINDIALYIFDIVAWVLIWEATDIMLLQRPIINYNKIKCYAMIHSNVTFNNE